MPSLTRDTLVKAIRANLATGLDGQDLMVMADGDERTLILVPGGDHFAVTVQPVTFSVPGAPRKKAS